jgi:DNA-directed RNA polymerase II subunit RPB9
MASQFFTQSATQPAPAKQRGLGAGIKFCPECNNMLTPRAPPDGTDLLLVCQNCQKSYPTDERRIYVNILVRTSAQAYLAKRVISDDPCLRREDNYCESCEARTECVLFMAPTLAGQESFRQMWECSRCHHQWVSKEGDALGD